MFKRLRKLTALSIVLFFLLVTSAPVMEYYTLWSYKHAFKITGEPAYSTHTIVYNFDPVLAEQIYLSTRSLVGLDHINDKVTILNVLEKNKDGSILQDKEKSYLGLYNHNVIAFEGDTLTLHHEIAHFFLDRISSYDGSESYAQVVEKFYLFAYTYQKIHGSFDVIFPQN